MPGKNLASAAGLFFFQASLAVGACCEIYPMCGICGVFQFDGAPADGALVGRMTLALKHRGPDGEGTFISGPVGLGRRRLSIVDLDGGSQPMGNEDGSCQVVFNGEIY